jgi:predicted nucleotidyltransferase
MAQESIIKRINITLIKRFVNALKEEGIHIDKVILYGSYAHGNPKADSDIDIAVVSKDFGKDPVEEGMLLFRIAGDIDSRIEPVPIPLESYEKDTWLPLIYEIREKGVTLNLAV